LFHTLHTLMFEDCCHHRKFVSTLPLTSSHPAVQVVRKAVSAQFEKMPELP
jgi:hypothetical protein